ncbi:hypothetical protein HK101_006627 [Irineochytrium annulatum]|nr:hypothetical protein HK101_006627 [Irineochytrium annulatum]
MGDYEGYFYVRRKAGEDGKDVIGTVRTRSIRDLFVLKTALMTAPLKDLFYIPNAAELVFVGLPHQLSDTITTIQDLIGNGFGNTPESPITFEVRKRVIDVPESEVSKKTRTSDLDDSKSTLQKLLEPFKDFDADLVNNPKALAEFLITAIQQPLPTKIPTVLRRQADAFPHEVEFVTNSEAGLVMGNALASSAWGSGEQSIADVSYEVFIQICVLAKSYIPFEFPITFARDTHDT